MSESSNFLSWQDRLTKTLNIFVDYDSTFSALCSVVKIEIENQIPADELFLNTLDLAIANCELDKTDALIAIEKSNITSDIHSIGKALHFFKKLRKIYLNANKHMQLEIERYNYTLSWQGQLESFFTQDSLEDLAYNLAEIGGENIAQHHIYTYIFETAIAISISGNQNAMKAINNSGSYMPGSIEETIRLLTDFYNLYLQSYEKHASKM